MICKICKNNSDWNNFYCKRCIDLKYICYCNFYLEIDLEICRNCEWYLITCKDKESFMEYVNEKQYCCFYIENRSI